MMGSEPPDQITATRVDGRSRRSARPLAEPSVRFSVADTELISGTVEEVIDRDMHRRMVAFAPFVIAIIATVGLSSFLLGGDPMARDVMLGTMGMCFATALWMVRRLRTRVHVAPLDLAVFGSACAFTLTSAYYYFGVLSAALVLMPVGAFVFPVVSSRRGMLAAFGFMMMHSVLATLTISGVLPDRGLIRPLGLSPMGQYLSLVITDLVAVAAYFIGRQTQFSAQRALLDLERATREAAQRGDLLAEARADLAQALRVGRAGRFTGQTVGGMRLGTVLGRGAMGEVYEATRDDGQPCAIKLLHPQLAVDRSYYARFVREAKIAASLQVPNVVKVLDASDEDAVLPYLVMERLYGKDLALHLQDVTRLRVAEALDMVQQIGLGLDAAHAAGIIHRDLKPQNVFRAEMGKRVVWKVLDFGVSKLLEQTSTMSAGVVVGTPQYMAPEQARGEAVDARADLYSLALIAYRALTGRPPFVVNDVRALLAIGAVRMPPRPSAIAPIPKELDDVLAVGMSKEPSDRFPTARALFDALRVAARGDVDKDIRARAQSVLKRWPWDDLTRGEGKERELDPLSE